MTESDFAKDICDFLCKISNVVVHFLLYTHFTTLGNIYKYLFQDIIFSVSIK